MRFDLDAMPEVFVSNEQIASAVSRAVKRGDLRRLARGLYTRDLSSPPEEIVARHLWHIVGLLCPGAVIADRTALEHGPASDGSVFVSAGSRREVRLPGLWLRARKGPGPLEGDRPFVGGLHLPSPARAFLENMAPSRARKGVARTLPREEIERRLESDIRTRGEPYINELRDTARRLAPELGLEREATELDRLIGALLASRAARLQTGAGATRAAGRPFDPDRIELFEALHAELMRTAPPARLDPGRAGEELLLPFFEAYFSNFIEGTVFEVDEARRVVFEGLVPAGRPADAHDVLGTFEVVSDRGEMSRIPRSTDELLELLRARHARIMAARPERRPGELKTRANRAGATVFVAPELVVGTLHRGFEYLQSLDEGFRRALFAMFLVTEVHPFDDGNGRVARIMMNAELVAAGQRRILIPIVYRDDYLTALKALSRASRAAPLVQMLTFAQTYTHAVDFGDWDRALEQLRRTHALTDPLTADATGVRLQLP